MKPTEQAQLFNDHVAPGDEVLYHPGPGPRGGTPRKVVVTAPALVLGGHTAVAYCSGLGAVAVEHLATIEGKDIVPASPKRRPA